MAKATTVRFADEIYARLDQASARTGMPVNSIVVAACLEWMDRHLTSTATLTGPGAPTPIQLFRPRWSTLRRAVKLAKSSPATPRTYPFESLTGSAKKMLTLAQEAAVSAGADYIGTEHLLQAAFGDPAFDSARVLNGLGINRDDVLKALESLLRAEKPKHVKDIVPTSGVKKVIELSFDICGEMGTPRVTTAHVLAALAYEGEGAAAHVLRDIGVTADAIGSKVASFTESEP